VPLPNNLSSISIYIILLEKVFLKVSYMREFLANIIYYLHLIVFFPVFLAFFYKSGTWLKYNLIFIPLILIDWNDYDDQCALTSMEAKLRGTWKPGGAEANEDAPAFFQPLLNKILKPFNVQVNRNVAGKINTLMFLVAFLVSLIRFMRLKKISFLPETFIGKLYVKFLFLFTFIYIINIFYRGPAIDTRTA